MNHNSTIPLNQRLLLSLVIETHAKDLSTYISFSLLFAFYCKESCACPYNAKEAGETCRTIFQTSPSNLPEYAG